MKHLITVLLAFHCVSFADDVFRIEIGKDYQKYSHSDLQKRVWELERAVWQLQHRVFQLEAGPTKPVVDTWVCTITAMNQTYTGTGISKATATAKSIEVCKAGRDGDSFFCKSPVCEQ